MERLPKTASGKISLARGIHCHRNIFITSFAPDRRLHIVKNTCIHTHTYLTPYRLYKNCRCYQICYQITLQWNISTQIGALMRSVDWIFIVRAPVWWWPDQYVTLGGSLGKWPTWCTIMFYNTFIIIILYMFRATLCSSSGGQIVLIQHLVFCVSDRPVCRLRRSSFSTCTPDGRSLTEVKYYTRCCINTIWPPNDEHSVARNMLRIIIINVLYAVIVHQVGHLPRVKPGCTVSKI